MYRTIILFLALSITFEGFCQNKIKEVATIDGEKIYMEEFVRLYQKNNQNLLDNSEKKTPEEYINLFINYKLKVHEAEKQGMDTIPAFVNELKSYRKELAHPYLTDVQFSKQMVKEAYNRTINEVKASHLLLSLAPNALPKDTLAVYNKIMEIRSQIHSEKDFEQMAFQYSEDPSAKNNKGLLGYFSAFQMVFPFEHAAYHTPVGEISIPVRTRFGYHLIYVLDKRPSSGQIKVAHIMKRIPADASEETVNIAKTQMDSIAGLINNGKDFAELARKFSDDRRSASHGGEMDWFTSSGMMPEFANPAFTLQNNGDVSSVIRTPYGWHIIKRIAYKSVPTYEEVEQQLIDKIRQNPAISKHSKQLFVNKLKASYQYKPNLEAIDKFIELATPQIENDGLKSLRMEEPDQILFSYADQQIRSKDFSAYLNTAVVNTKNAKKLLISLFENFVEELLTNYEDQQLEDKYPDFKYLMKEYHDGILLFNISEQKIWSAASSDTLGLNIFYTKNKGKYKWGERFKGWAVKCPNQKVKDFADEILTTDNNLSIEEFTDQIKQHTDLDIVIEKDAFEKGDNPLVDYLVWGGVKPTDFQDGLHFIRGNKIAPEPKTLNEARGLYISDYQNYLEEQWLKTLRKRYKVKINKKAVKSVNPV